MAGKNILGGGGSRGEGRGGGRDVVYIPRLCTYYSVLPRSSTPFANLLWVLSPTWTDSLIAIAKENISHKNIQHNGCYSQYKCEESYDFTENIHRYYY